MTRDARVVLSDLDDTLFDHRRATRSALEVASGDSHAFDGWTLDELDRRHRKELDTLHLEVLAGKRTVDEARVERFFRLLRDAGTDRADVHAVTMAARYRSAYETVWHPVAGALELLTELRRAGRRVAIVTNNNVAEQRLKLDRCGFAPLVDALVTSEEAGISKPDPAIFADALRRFDCAPSDAVMLGDNWVADIEGAKAARIRAVWFNRFDDPLPDASVLEIRSYQPTDAALRVILGRPQ